MPKDKLGVIWPLQKFVMDNIIETLVKIFFIFTFNYNEIS